MKTGVNSPSKKTTSKVKKTFANTATVKNATTSTTTLSNTSSSNSNNSSGSSSTGNTNYSHAPLPPQYYAPQDSPYWFQGKTYDDVWAIYEELCDLYRTIDGYCWDIDVLVKRLEAINTNEDCWEDLQGYQVTYLYALITGTPDTTGSVYSPYMVELHRIRTELESFREKTMNRCSEVYNILANWNYE